MLREERHIRLRRLPPRLRQDLRDLLITFDDPIAGQMSPTGREIPDHRLPDHNGRFQLRLNLQLGLLGILTHMISASPRRTLPVSMTVRIIEEYAAHRQICPASADFTSSTDGLRFLSSRDFAVTSHPAVQKPQSPDIYR